MSLTPQEWKIVKPIWRALGSENRTLGLRVDRHNHKVVCRCPFCDDPDPVFVADTRTEEASCLSCRFHADNLLDLLEQRLEYCQDRLLTKRCVKAGLAMMDEVHEMLEAVERGEGDHHPLPTPTWRKVRYGK
jgi:hypothetical protein